MSCEACAIATANPDTGHIKAGCRGCGIRVASKLPRQFREEAIAGVRQREGDAAAEVFLREVLAEFARRQAWRRSVA